MDFAISIVVQQPAVGRRDFKLPVKWGVNAQEVIQANLKGGRSAVLRSALDQMAKCSDFIQLVSALKSDDCWYRSQPDEVSKHGADRAFLHAAVVLGKILVHACYNLSSGELLQHDLAHLLSIAELSFTSPVIKGLKMPQVARAFDEFSQDGTLSVWQAVRAHMAETIRAFLWPIEAIETHEEHQDIQSSLQWTTDEIGAVVRSILSVSGAIQTRHMRVMRLAKTIPKKPVFPLVRKINKASSQEDHWRNYIADLALMWLLIRNMTDALEAMDIVEFTRVVQCGRFWSISACLVKSAKAIGWEKVCRRYLADVQVLALKLHNLYMRLGTLCLSMSETVFGAERVRDAWSNILTVAFGRIHMHRKPVEHVHGATLVDRQFWWTITASPEKFGLVDSESGECILGCTEKDYETTLRIGVIAMAVTQSEPHLWVAVTDVKGWSSLQHLLPCDADVAKRVLMPKLEWALSEAELSESTKGETRTK